ncbi:MAG: hypothetical protein ABIH86_06240 [Planctomycetota bacterium]
MIRRLIKIHRDTFLLSADRGWILVNPPPMSVQPDAADPLNALRPALDWVSASGLRLIGVLETRGGDIGIELVRRLKESRPNIIDAGLTRAFNHRDVHDSSDKIIAGLNVQAKRLTGVIGTDGRVDDRAVSYYLKDDGLFFAGASLFAGVGLRLTSPDAVMPLPPCADPDIYSAGLATLFPAGMKRAVTADSVVLSEPDAKRLAATGVVALNLAKATASEFVSTHPDLPVELLERLIFRAVSLQRGLSDVVISARELTRAPGGTETLYERFDQPLIRRWVEAAQSAKTTGGESPALETIDPDQGEFPFQPDRESLLRDAERFRDAFDPATFAPPYQVQLVRCDSKSALPDAPPPPPIAATPLPVEPDDELDVPLALPDSVDSDAGSEPMDDTLATSMTAVESSVSATAEPDSGPTAEPDDVEYLELQPVEPADDAPKVSNAVQSAEPPDVLPVTNETNDIDIRLPEPDDETKTSSGLRPVRRRQHHARRLTAKDSHSSTSRSQLSDDDDRFDGPAVQEIAALNVIRPGVGSDRVQIGMTRAVIDNELRDTKRCVSASESGGIIVDYPSNGIAVVYDKDADDSAAVEVVFVFNPSTDESEGKGYQPFDGEVEGGINAACNQRDIIDLFGTADTSGGKETIRYPGKGIAFYMFPYHLSMIWKVVARAPQTAKKPAAGKSRPLTRRKRS